MKSVKAEPDDDTARLVLADWLQEQSDPADVARGEWLRLQTELPYRVVSDPVRRTIIRRLRELEGWHGAAWAGPLTDAGFLVVWPSCRWGLLTVRANLAELATDRAMAVAGTEAFAWVGTLQLTALHGGGYTRFCDGPFLDRLVRLDLTGFARTFLPAPELANNDRLGGLRELDLGGTLAGERDGVVYLAASPHLGALRRLGLNDCGIGDRGARALAESPHLGGLRELDVRNNPIGRTGAGALRERFGARVRLDGTGP